MADANANDVSQSYYEANNVITFQKSLLRRTHIITPKIAVVTQSVFQN